MVLEINGKKRLCKLTLQGITDVKDYIKALKKKRKEILNAKLDTANETMLPTLEDIVSDIEQFFDDQLMEYCNSWGITDSYSADVPLCLKFGKDITFAEKA